MIVKENRRWKRKQYLIIGVSEIEIRGTFSRLGVRLENWQHDNVEQKWDSAMLQTVKDMVVNPRFIIGYFVMFLVLYEPLQLWKDYL